MVELVYMSMIEIELSVVVLVTIEILSQELFFEFSTMFDPSENCGVSATEALLTEYVFVVPLFVNVNVSADKYVTDKPLSKE